MDSTTVYAADTGNSSAEKTPQEIRKKKERVMAKKKSGGAFQRLAGEYEEKKDKLSRLLSEKEKLDLQTKELQAEVARLREEAEKVLNET